MTLPDKIPDYTNLRVRKDNIMLTRIRNRSSNLKVNIIQSPVWSCGAPIKNAEHYFCECPLYTYQKSTLFMKLHRLQNNDDNAVVLTAGSHNYNQFAMKFIKDSQRSK